ncbi:hypothetical protein PIROE2DRAFT_17107 [Piromyces sp. E2]|nr:hypothetical protein PIROE2DRAFT_17107 [Piromyces sp. E2]|eukprot:OUM57794.1 hypothetical protein PIROE2DRAFT_17107 [Piromyces sp. E2]
MRPKHHDNISIGNDSSDEEIPQEREIHFESKPNADISITQSMFDFSQKQTSFIAGDGNSLLPPHPNRMSRIHSDTSQVINGSKLNRLTRLISNASQINQNNPKPLRICNVINDESQYQSKRINSSNSPNISVKSIQLSKIKESKSVVSDTGFFEETINENIIKKIKKAMKYEQDSYNKLWYHKCLNEDSSITYNAIEIVILIIIIIKGNSLLVYNGIFKCSIYTVYTSWIALIFGPIINIISIIFLQNYAKARIYVETLLNSIGYFIILITFSWDKVYYILKKQGNEAYTYFVFKRHEQCHIHKSTCCGCRLNMTREHFQTLIRKSIDFYRICTQFFEITDQGKLMYIGTQSKIKYLQYN